MADIQYPFIINIAFLILLILIAALKVLSFNAELPQKEGKFYFTDGMIKNYPYDDKAFQIIKLNEKYIKVPLYPRYQLGDYIKVLYTKESKFISYPKITKIDSKSSGILNAIDTFRNKIVDSIRKSIHEPYSGLILGMTIGFKEPFPENFNDLLISAGVIHVIVVSGYNVTLLQNLLESVSTSSGRFIYITVNIVFLVLYLLIVGLEAPILRAVIMGFFSAFAMSVGRKRDSFYILLLTAILMIICRPQYLTDLSFQLTFLSTASVMFINGVLKNIDGIKKEILLSILVNILLYPFIAYYFGRVSLFAIPANISVSWVIPLITISGFIYLAFKFYLLKVFLISLIDYFISIVKLADYFSFMNLSLNLGISGLFLCYFLIITCLLIIKIYCRAANVENI